jgi:hypothetical protein
MMSSRTAASAALDSTFGRRSLTAASNSRVKLMMAARPLGSPLAAWLLGAVETAHAGVGLRPDARVVGPCSSAQCGRKGSDQVPLSGRLIANNDVGPRSPSAKLTGYLELARGAMIHLAHQPEALRVDEAACKLRWPSVRIPSAPPGSPRKSPAASKAFCPSRARLGSFTRVAPLAKPQGQREKAARPVIGVTVWPGRPRRQKYQLSLERRRLTPATIGPTPALPFSIHSADRGAGPVRLFRA